MAPRIITRITVTHDDGTTEVFDGFGHVSVKNNRMPTKVATNEVRDGPNEWREVSAYLRITEST